MQTGNSLKEKAEKAIEKSAMYGEDFDLNKFEIAAQEVPQTDDLENLDDDFKKTLLNVGVLTDEKDRSGSFLMLDNGVSHSSLKDPNIELMSLHEALEKHDWLKDYSWKLVSVDADKYTAKSYLEDANGYFIRAPAGQKSSMPVQTCLVMGHKDVAQTVHNIIIVEEDAKLDVITGCTTKKGVERAIHLGISEIYVKKGGILNFTMIHNWAGDVGVRPRTVIHLEEGASFVNNYILLKPVRSIQSYPTAILDGEGAFARFHTIAVAHPGSELDLGSRVLFNAPNTKAELISRTITTGGKVIARGEMVANKPHCKGHLECHGLVLKDGGTQLAIPALEASVADVELTHEAAVGRIAREQVEYLMARGLSEEDAVGMIVRGFLDVGITGLPDELAKDIDDTIAQIGKDAV
ncbi:SufB/SufD family protein [Methanococcoides burtonii]|uniref:FeS cluster assembly protein sufB n=1 Tax=Methanococcoides burtonii (strain DSM 6242 / NBRC 107633 / OCM 468 / ACE-M) TaxID=259564 RepID=Q12YK3_METBU|nr:SufD family Fe-S cluster assembly protein [Methanococcoides burtonii]ABE51473.1 FeS cluster assembly protein sufB [Methanococcoides burtonii DSM 6242]